MWGSSSPLDAYGLVHMASAAGDALVAVALADSVFFSVPVDQARIRVSLYLALTMAPLAVAAPLLVPVLDRSGFRRAVSFVAAAGRSLLALYAAPRADTLVLFPAVFGLLVLSRVHGVTKNGLTASYAPGGEGLVRVNGRLGRLAVAGGAVAAAPGLALAAAGGPPPVLYLATAAYGGAALLTLRLARPGELPPALEGPRRGRIAALALPAARASALRAASGFLLFLLAFALRRSGQPPSWYAVLAGAAVAGGFASDALAPRVPPSIREESLLVTSLVAAGGAAFLAFRVFALPVLALFAAVAGMATEMGRLAFQSLMQRMAPGGAQGRVFVRYEVQSQLAWVSGAILAALLPVTVGSVTLVPLSFRGGILFLALFYLAVAALYLVHSPDRAEPEG